MNHMKFESPDMTALNIDRIAVLFPNCVTDKVYPLSRTFLSNRQTVTVTFPADNFLFPIGCMK